MTETVNTDIADIAAKLTAGAAFERDLQAQRKKAEKEKGKEKKRKQKQAEKQRRIVKQQTKTVGKLIKKTINHDRLYKKLNRNEKRKLIRALQNDEELRSSILDVMGPHTGAFKHFTKMTVIYAATMAVMVVAGLGISSLMGGSGITGGAALFVVAFGTVSVDTGYNLARNMYKSFTSLRKRHARRAACRQEIASAIPSLGQAKPLSPATSELTAFTEKTLTDKFSKAGCDHAVEQDNASDNTQLDSPTAGSNISGQASRLGKPL